MGLSGVSILKRVFVFVVIPKIATANPVPDFQLIDVNATSPRSGAVVSPRDYRHQVTAYYFGAAT